MNTYIISDIENNENNENNDKIKDKREIILPTLYNFYKENDHIYIILPIISGCSSLSIRVLDWFVTNYAKKYNVVYQLDTGTYFNVYLDYKSQLKGYKKKMFDPFCRKRRIPFYYEENKCVITTIGQLNFFKWSIKNEVINYVINNFQKINEDMTISNKKSNTKKIRTTSSSSVSSDNIHQKPFTIILNN
jgi:hypothetical protein